MRTNFSGISSSSISVLFIEFCNQNMFSSFRAPKVSESKSETFLISINMKKYVCDVCGWEYDPEVGYPEGGIAPGTAWEDVPEDFVCPLCGVGKDEFSAE